MSTLLSNVSLDGMVPFIPSSAADGVVDQIDHEQPCQPRTFKDKVDPFVLSCGFIGSMMLIVLIEFLRPHTSH